MENKDVKVYLDEDVRPLLARILRERGCDVISAVEMKRTGLSDEEQILYVIKEKRALFTHNTKDFIKLHKKYWNEHFGIIVSEHLSFGILLRRISKFLAYSSFDEVKGKINWLSSFK
ncbi:MAG: DUF5615 family PIN-like protein [bacterium]|nr:DUF5615 family PIN-like protein [bacterium]